MGGAGVVAYQDMGTLKPDELGCYATASTQNHHVVLAELSEPGVDETQSRDLIHAVSLDFQNNVHFNEIFSLISTREKDIGSIPAPVISKCGPARSSSDLEEVGAASATPAYLSKQADKLLQNTLQPALEDVFSSNPADGSRQRFESPIFEQIQAASRMPGFREAPEKRFSLVSDLMQNTAERQFCQTKGHLPSYAKFKTSDYFQRIKPASLDGADVKIYMLIRGQLGKKPYPYCRGEDELRSFWEAYFLDADAKSVEFVRIRPSGKR